MIKKIFITVLFLSLIQASTVVFAINDISLIVNGKKLVLDQKPIIQKGRILVPLRGILEKLGATVQWNDATKTVTTKKGSTTIQLKVNKNSAVINNKTISLDVPVKIVKGRAMVPLRFIAEGLGAKVSWNATKKTVTISNAVGSSVGGVGNKLNTGTGYTTLQKTNILNNKVEILIPKTCKIITGDLPGLDNLGEKPDIIYFDGIVAITFLHSYDRIRDWQITRGLYYAARSFKAAIPSLKISSLRVEKINGKDTGVIEASNQEIYSLTWFTELEGRALYSGFVCEKEEMSDLKPIGMRIMKSQRIK